MFNETEKDLIRGDDARGPEYFNAKQRFYRRTIYATDSDAAQDIPVVRGRRLGHMMLAPSHMP